MRKGRAAGCLLIGALAVVLGIGAVITALDRGDAPMLAEVQRCVATADDSAVVVDLEQAHYAALIAGVAMRRKLPPRAVSIALATAYQESEIRNLDYGDRDSIGLFQQRPSQGWGNRTQIMDPYYSTGEFYDALVKISNWQTDDINDVAQKVQRSGFPEAYRDHEADARVLSSVLTGQSRAALTCLERAEQTGQVTALRGGVTKTLGVSKAAVTGSAVVYRATSAAQTWAIAHHVLANSGRYGVSSVQVADLTWTHDPDHLPGWATVDQAAPSRQVVITLR
jgi:hypothetical protein